jgi:hydrogenase maturation protein HypF
VTRHAGSGDIIFRRSRGYAPAPIVLPVSCAQPILAVGGQLKNTFAIGRESRAFVSHHIGDLDELMALRAFERDIALFEQLFEVRPGVVAHDCHPDYASTRFAHERASATRIAVQHHHAHVASCMAEHGLSGPVIGVAWDGVGWGLDDCVWGGEFFVGDARAVERAAHLRYVAMPGGDRASREPWRMALAYAHDAGIDWLPVPDSNAGGDLVTPEQRRIVLQMIERGVNTPMTSSAGRLFDAVAALCGGRQITTYEGQAAMWLESIASTVSEDGVHPFDLVDDRKLPIVIDTRPLVDAIVGERMRGVAPAIVARRFHSTLVCLIRDVCAVLRRQTGLTRVVLSGGVFLNTILTVELEQLLPQSGFEVYRHRVVSPGDGGLSLGQLAVAAAQQER